MSQASNSIDSLRQWFRQCPLLSKSNRFGADYLGENPTEYAIYASPSTLKYRENILGESVLEDTFVVWSCKTLQNHKALISTTVPDGMYYEITYNGDKGEMYLDAYKKMHNECIKIEED